MTGIREVLITSEASGQLWNTCVWEPHSATSLISFKGGTSAAGTLALLHHDYILSAVNHKPLIHVWSLHKKDQMQQRMVCPGQVTVLAVSPDGGYCIAAVDDKIHLWQVSSGHLLAVLSRHYQTVRCLRFTDDGSHFVSGGDDNFVAVWSLSSILCSRGDPNPGGSEPRWLWTAHSLAVTCIHVGRGGPRAIVVTVSLDQTCRVWDMSSGDLLSTVVFETSLSSVAMDNAESRVFVGTVTGDICQINLYQSPVQVERHFSEDDQSSLVFTGHSKQVTCLGVSLDGRVLASGSHDTSVKLWDIHSRQCTRTIPHKGAVTNVLLVVKPAGLLSSDRRPTLPVQTFQRHLYTGEEEGQRHTLAVRLHKRKSAVCSEESLTPEEDYLHLLKKKDTSHQNNSEEKETEDLQPRISRLCDINKELHDFAVKKILGDENIDH